MKKSLLLTTAFALVATVASAQPFAEGVPFSARNFSKKVVPTFGAQAKPSKLRAEQKSNYYLRPTGALYQASDKAGQMWGPVYMYVPGASDVKFKTTRSGNEETAWHLNAFNFDGDCTSVDCSLDGSSYYTDANGDFHIKMTFDGGNSLPTLVWATDSFTIGEENPYFGDPTVNKDKSELALMKYYPQIYSGIDQANRRLQPLSFTDDHISEVFFGGMDNMYVYGSGTFTQNEKSYKATGIYQYFDKPMAPLYVEDIFMPVISKGYYPIAEGKELKMQIHDVLVQDGKRIPGEKILFELTAKAADVLDVGSVEYDNETSFNAFNLVFTKKNSDGKAEPFVIDQDFYIVIDGLDGEGIDCGFEGHELPYYYDDYEPAVGIWSADGAPGFFSLYSHVALKVTFTGKFDYCNPMYYGPEENYGIVRMSNDGNTGETVAKGDKFPGAMIKLNGSWFNSNDEAMYTITGDEDWVKSIAVDEQSYKDYEVVMLTFKCDPLPEGVSGRKCSLTLHGQGVNSTYPIEILQGDATPTGISNVTVKTTLEGNTYNAAGQRVADNAKGLVVRGGKKYLNK